MDKKKLAKVVRDVKKILILAKSAHDYLEAGKIRKAKRELKRVMSFDADEITRLHNEDEGMAHQLLHECGVVLKDAKKALRDLDSNELFDEAKRLVDEIVKLEGHEWIELKEEEHKKNELYEYWHDQVKTQFLFHGTTEIVRGKVERYGLAPQMRPWDPHDWERFILLYEKGAGGPWHYDYWKISSSFSQTKGSIHLASNYNLAERHAKYGAPSVWAEAVPNWRSLERNFHKNKKWLVREISSTGNLKREEINECTRIFSKFWRLFNENDQPIIIFVFSNAPAIQEKFGLSFYSYSGFINFFENLTGEKSPYFPRGLNGVSFYCRRKGISRDGHGNIKVTKRIPKDYIAKIKEV